MKEPTSTSTHPSCTIRPFESRDREALLSLYETVFGRERSPNWFRWKFEDNPYVDHVPIIVAEADGELVGCRAFFAQEMRVDGTERLAFQPCDTMVHPGYQGQGVFSRMNERALERYTDGEPAFCFNFPNENSKPGNLKHGWREVGTFPVYYRPQDPVGSVRELTEGDDDEPTADDPLDRIHHDVPDDFDEDGDDVGRMSQTLSDVITNSQLAGDRLLTKISSDVAVIRFESPPANVLETIYRRSIPDEIHTNRTAAFYRWRFDNPAREYTTYVAMRNGETPVAALVLSPVRNHVRIVETLPRTIDGERETINRLLTVALTDCPDRNYVTAFGQTLPTPIRYRFYPDTRFPLSTLIRPTARTLLARDLGDGPGLEETACDDWSLSRLDLDTS